MPETVAADESRSPLVALGGGRGRRRFRRPAACRRIRSASIGRTTCMSGLRNLKVGQTFLSARRSPAHHGRQECLPHLAGCRPQAGRDSRRSAARPATRDRHRPEREQHAWPTRRRSCEDTAATLRDLSGREHDRTGVLIDLLRRLDATFSQLREDPQEVAGRADLALPATRPDLDARWTDRKVTGVCRGIAADGAIMLETSGGVETFLSGSVES